MKIPSKITKADSVSWIDEPTSDNLGNSIDSSQWTLKYAIRGAVTLNLTAIANGSGWKTILSATNSDTLTAGKYFWQAYAEKGDERVTLGSGSLEVLPNLVAATTGFDGRSEKKRFLDDVQAAIKAIATGGVQEYSIGSRTFKKINLGELRALETQLKFEVKQEERQERMKAGLGDPNNLRVRF